MQSTNSYSISYFLIEEFDLVVKKFFIGIIYIYIFKM